jgi:hypothetical protein
MTDNIENEYGINSQYQLNQDLNIAINNNDEEGVRSLLENNIIPQWYNINDAINSRNYNIINLIFTHKDYEYETQFFGHDILLAANINNPDIINMIIEHYRNNNKLDFILSKKVFIRNLIQKIKSLNEINLSRSNEIIKLLYSLLFRSCFLSEVDKLKDKLNKLGINEINGKLINNIDSSHILCNLIERNLDFNINQYDDRIDISTDLKFVD